MTLTWIPRGEQDGPGRPRGNNKMESADGRYFIRWVNTGNQYARWPQVFYQIHRTIDDRTEWIGNAPDRESAKALCEKDAREGNR